MWLKCGCKFEAIIVRGASLGLGGGGGGGGLAKKKRCALYRKRESRPRETQPYLEC